MSLAITICATKSYQYALAAQARAIQANVMDIPEGHIILVTDKSPVTGILEQYRDLLGEGWTVHHIPLAVTDGHTNYKADAQLTIAQMRTAAFSKARALRVDHVWSLDSDVLPPANALRCSLQMVEFDSGYYDVATCPYPSQGGGGFLFGRGTMQHQIADDIYEDERQLSKEFKAKLKLHRDFLKKLKPGEHPPKEWFDADRTFQEEIKQAQPIFKNSMEANAARWRKRGWGDVAYPAIGKGAIVPSDWCGFGCTLLSKRALSFADFSGYQGAGTEDLYIVWRRWFPQGIRIAAIPHVLCSHVIRKKDKSGYVLVHAFHETEGETVGHIRQELAPWYSHEPGETFTEENDGRL